MDRVEAGLEDLVTAIAALAATEPVERARQAKGLIDRSKAVLSRTRRAAIAEALRGGRTYEQLAAELGVSAAAINAAVTAYVADGGTAPSGRARPGRPLQDGPPQPGGRR